MIFCSVRLNAQLSQYNNRLVAYYPLNGNFMDASGKGLHASASGNIAFVNDKWGNANSAARFDGVDDYIIAPVANFKTSFTVYFQFRFDTSSARQMLFSKCDYTSPQDSQLFVDINSVTPVNRLRLNITKRDVCAAAPTWVNAGITAAPLAPDQWYCVWFSYNRDSNITRLFVYNATGHTYYHSTTSTRIDTCTTAPMIIGSYLASNPLFFKGAMDEVRVYDTALGVHHINDAIGGQYCNAAPLFLTTFNDTLQCPGKTFNASYTGGTLLPGNTVFIQLSNATGSFANPVTIGSAITTTTPGTINCAIPINTTPGTGYRIRAVSTSVNDTSADNGKNIRITAYPSVSASSNAPVCTGTTLNLTSTATTGSSFSWSGPSFSSTLQNPSLSNTPLTAGGDYVVTATLYTCSSKDTVTVQVKPIPAAPVAGSNSPVCPNTPINLSANSIAGASYNWTGPSFSSAMQNPVINNAAVANAGGYSVTATVNGCTSAAGGTSVVVATPAANYTASSNSPVCAGGVLNLDVTNIPGANYHWSGPNLSSNLQQPSIDPVSGGDAGVYSVYAEVNGCVYPPVTTTVAVNSVSSLGVYPSPNDTLCELSPNATLVAVPFNAGTSPQYQWYKNGNLISGATSVSYPATGIADGDTFRCRMIVTGQCPQPLTLFSNKIGITVLPMTSGPSVTITADPPGQLKPWQMVKFTAVAANAGTDPKYQWKRNGQNVAGATSFTWSANNLSHNDTITCEVTSGVWCANPPTAKSNRIDVNIALSIDDVNGGGGVSLYPNPNNGTFTLELKELTGTATLEVVNALGQTVYTSMITDRKSQIILPVANGVYLLRISTADANATMRVLIER